MAGKKKRQAATGAFPESQTRNNRHQYSEKSTVPDGVPPDAPKHLWRPMRRLLAAAGELSTAGAAIAGFICYRNVDGKLSELALIDQLAATYYADWQASRTRSTDDEVQA